MRTITSELIESGKSIRGAWSRKQLALLGVSWPPAAGWKDRIIGTLISDSAAEQFVSIRSTRPKKVPSSDTQPSLPHAEPAVTSCCGLKALAVFRTVKGETRVDVTCRKCKRVIEPNLPHKEAIRRARKGNFFLIEPSEE